MNASRPWEFSPRTDVYDKDDLHRELNRMRRALCAVTRSYNQTKKELEDIKEATGFYDKPFPFLELPRELRDQIYEYALISRLDIIPGPRPIEHLGLHPSDSKPPTPGLCLVNRKIYSEAIEILYGRNKFSFKTAGELVKFEEEIGSAHRKLVRSLDISTLLVTANSSVPNPDLAIPHDWSYFPTHWSKIMRRSGLTGVVEMTITVLNPHSSGKGLVTVGPVLQEAIKELLGREPNGDLKRRLVLRWVSESEKDKFPSDWEVLIEPWDNETEEVLCSIFFD
jgi:hypothetical protein